MNSFIRNHYRVKSQTSQMMLAVSKSSSSYFYRLPEVSEDVVSLHYGTGSLAIVGSSAVKKERT